MGELQSKFKVPAGLVGEVPAGEAAPCLAGLGQACKWHVLSPVMRRQALPFQLPSSGVLPVRDSAASSH